MLGSMVGVDPTSAAQNNLVTDKFGVGSLYSTKNGKIYRWVRVEDTALVAGDPVYWASADGAEVTRDVSGGSRISDTAAGIAIVACADTNYCFVQCAGVGDVALTADAGDFTAGESIVADINVDGKVDTMAAGEEDHVIGTALANSTSSVLAAGAYVLQGMI